MKWLSTAAVIALAGAMLATETSAQQIRQPVATPSRFTYDYYRQPGDSSPSDLEITPDPQLRNPAPRGVDPRVTDPAYEIEQYPNDGMVVGEEYFAEDEYYDDEEADDTLRLFPDLWYDFTLTGWINAGVYGNNWNNPSQFNGPVTFNDRDDFMLNQLYAVLERPAETGNDYWTMGARADLLYGTDARFTQAVGLELDQTGAYNLNAGQRFHHLAFPQFYAEFAKNDFRVKVGHFYTIIGYQGVMAPSNFFVSQPYTFQYGEPFTHTGFLASWEYSSNWTFLGGMHFGWDTFDSALDRAGFLGGVNWKNDDENHSLSFAISTGDEPTFGALQNRTMYSLVWNWQINDYWNYVLHHDLGTQAGGNPVAPGVLNSQWYSVNQYLFRQINDKWTAGLRYEWFQDSQGTRVVPVGIGNPNTGPFVGDFHELALGLNWKPHSNIIVRPEMRWDWFANQPGQPLNRAFNDGNNNSQFMIGMDAIIHW